MAQDKEEKEVLGELYEVNDLDVFIAVMNHYSKIKTIRDRMVTALDLLDKAHEGDEEAKERLRSHILDNFNDLPRDTRKFIEELSQSLKE